MAKLKTARDIAGIYRSGQITGQLLVELEARVRPGVTTAELDRFAAEFIARHGGTAAFLNYKGYPASLCVSINEQIVHGIPGSRVIQPGDLVSLDVGVVLAGYVSDAACTYFAGGAEPSPEVVRLMQGTQSSLALAIGAMHAGQPLRLVSRAVESELKRHKLFVIRELTGHGVGFALHEEPVVYNFDPRVRKPLLENGLVLAIEPMASLGTSEILLAADQWTYLTVDGSLAAHYEHSIACWDDRAFVLTDPAADDSRQAFGKVA